MENEVQAAPYRVNAEPVQPKKEWLLKGFVRLFFNFLKPQIKIDWTIIKQSISIILFIVLMFLHIAIVTFFIVSPFLALWALNVWDLFIVIFFVAWFIGSVFYAKYLYENSEVFGFFEQEGTIHEFLSELNFKIIYNDDGTIKW